MKKIYKPLEYYMNNEDYMVVDIPSKHGQIHLIVPKREPTEEEKRDFHRKMAEVMVDEFNLKQREKKEKGEY